MRRLAVIPGLLFGLLFAGGGYFIFAETGLPMWQNWQRMQDWRPQNAQLLSLVAAENDTRASYRYDYAGTSYQGSRVGVSDFKDNIGDYHAELQAWLREIRRKGTPLPIWVNPVNPAEAAIDRDMRWGLFALVCGFCSVFMLIGAGVVFASLRAGKSASESRRPSLLAMRRTWQAAQRDGSTDQGFIEFAQTHYAQADFPAAESKPPALASNWRSRKGWEGPQIHSSASKGLWFFWGFALIWNAGSSPLLFVLPDELGQNNYLALIGLLFPVIGLGMLYKAIIMTLEYHHFGKLPLTLDPWPGSIGGHVGGRLLVKKLDYRRALEARSLLVKLECVYSYLSGSGKNRSRRESIKWAEQGQPEITPAPQGVNLGFRFDVPEGLPPADVEQTGAYHFWRLGISAEVPGIDLDRSYNIPVFATAETSDHVAHDISARVAAERRQESEAAKLAISRGQFDIEGLARALRFKNEGNRILLHFPMFRNKLLTLIATVFAGGFGFACYSMADMAGAGGLFAIFIAVFMIPFLLVALVAAIAALYLPFNNLRVTIAAGEVSVLRRWLFIPVFRRRLVPGDISHLEIKRSGSTGQGVDKITHFKIRAQDKNASSVTLAEDIDGEDVALHLRDYLAARIGVEAR